MLLTKEVEIHVTARTVNHYKEKGYFIPTHYSEKSGKEVIDSSVKFFVRVEDLFENSKIKIRYKCDNCGLVGTITYCDWHKHRYLELGDLCKSCAIKIKLPQAMMEKYGHPNCINVPSITTKKKDTNLKRYGNEWAIASDEIKNNISNIFLEKYGSVNPMQSDEIKQKVATTNQEKYGGKSPMCDSDVRTKSVTTCIEKYGVPNPFQHKEFQEKARHTRYQNGNVPSSKPEMFMCNILKEMFGENNCFPSYPEGALSLDCLVKIGGEQIDFEYDGYFWHKNRGQKDAARNAVLMNKGYRIVRIKANNSDIMPTKQQIQEAVDYLVKDNHHLAFIDMNN